MEPGDRLQLHLTPFPVRTSKSRQALSQEGIEHACLLRVSQPFRSLQNGVNVEHDELPPAGSGQTREVGRSSGEIQGEGFVFHISADHV